MFLYLKLFDVLNNGIPRSSTSSCKSVGSVPAIYSVSPCTYKCVCLLYASCNPSTSVLGLIDIGLLFWFAAMISSAVLDGVGFFFIYFS